MHEEMTRLARKIIFNGGIYFDNLAQIKKALMQFTLATIKLSTSHSLARAVF